MPDLSVCWMSRDTLGAGFRGLGESAAVVSQQLAQDVNRNTQGGTSELRNRGEEVYAGAVDGLSSSDINSVVEELESGVSSVVQGVEREAEVLKKAFREALHRAMGSVALLGRGAHGVSFVCDSANSDSGIVAWLLYVSCLSAKFQKLNLYTLRTYCCCVYCSQQQLTTFSWQK